MNEYIEDMVQATKDAQTDEVNVVAYVVGLGYRGIYYIANGRAYLIRRMSVMDANMADPYTLESFIDWAIDNYPAEHYTVLISSHGAGVGFTGTYSLIPLPLPRPRMVVPKVCIEDNQNAWSGIDWMSIYELHWALKSIAQKIGKKIDLVWLDMCDMSTIETIYGLKDAAEYVIASEDEKTADAETAYTYVYTLCSDPDISARDLGMTIVDKYAQQEDDSLFLIDTTRIADLAQAVSSLGDALGENVPEIDDQCIVNRIEEEQTNGFIPHAPDVDLLCLVQTILSSFPDSAVSSAAQQIISILPEVVVYSQKAGFGNEGLSIYLPIYDNTWELGYFSMTEEYLLTDFARDTHWDEYLERAVFGTDFSIQE